MEKRIELLPEQQEQILRTLRERFHDNMSRHKDLHWLKVESKLKADLNKLWSLNEMEKTGGEPDVVFHNEETDTYVFYDCSLESPKGRRSLCYDREALESRKQHKPKTSATDMAQDMKVELLNEEEYRDLQKLENFDTKTSSWLATPSEIRELGGAIFGDFRYAKVFVYHNGAQSYYASRGFRAKLEV